MLIQFSYKACAQILCIQFVQYAYSVQIYSINKIARRDYFFLKPLSFYFTYTTDSTYTINIRTVVEAVGFTGCSEIWGRALHMEKFNIITLKNNNLVSK